MKYTSEKIEEIVTSPSAKRALDYITPIYHDAYVALWFMQVMGLQTDVIVRVTKEFEQQILPQTATWLLPYWEEQYGIAANAAQTIEERRNAILSAVRTRAPMNPAKVEKAITMLTGLPADIIENTAKYAFRLLLYNAEKSELVKKAQAFLNQVKPAHLSYDILCCFPTFSTENRNAFYFSNFVLLAKHYNYTQKIIRLDGEKNLDGSWILATIFDQTIRFVHLQILTEMKNNNTCSVFLTVDSLYRFDGAVSFNGKRKLDAAITRQEV